MLDLSMRLNLPSQPNNTDHSCEHIMDHRSDHSTDDSTDDLADCNNYTDICGSLYQSSQWCSDSELARAWGSRGGSGRRRALHQDYSQFYRENRSASCPAAPEHRAPSPLCHPDNPEQLLKAPMGVQGGCAVRPEDQTDDSRCYTPGSAGLSDKEGSGAELVFSPPPIKPPWDHFPSVSGGATEGEAGRLGGTTVDPSERLGEKGCGPPKPPAKPSLKLPPQEQESASCLSQECSTPDLSSVNQERGTQQSAPQDEGEECGGTVGMKVPPPSGSQQTNTLQGQSSPTSLPSGSCTTSPPATTSPALPAQRSPPARETTVPGRAHRWRWTPEHKLQPEFKPERRRRVQPHPSPGSEESDIPPFAERMRFFEETSRSRSVSHLPGLACPAPRPKVRPADRRRYSYQDSELYCPPGGKEPANPEPDCHNRALRPEDLKLDVTVDMQSSGSLCDSSTFHPIATPDHQDYSQQQCRSSHSRNTPTEVQHSGENEQTQLNGKFSPTPRDHRCTGELQTPDEALTQDWQSQRGTTEAPESLPQGSTDAEAEQSQGQAASISEDETGAGDRCDSRLQAAIQGAVEAGSEPPRRKKDPPPRPPPPKWAQFHHRRASCHTLLSSPSSPPPSPLRPLPCPEVSRQRSHSFPLRDGGECLLYCPACAPGPALPASSALTHRVLRPVAPPVEQNPPLAHPDPLWLSDMHAAPQPRSRFYALQGRSVTGDDRQNALKQQLEAEWERRPTSDTQPRSGEPVHSSRLGSGVPMYGVQYSSGVPLGENGSVFKGNLPEPYFTMTSGPQNRTFSGNTKLETKPTHNAKGAGRGVPLETDIDQYLEEQRVRCLSRPTAVLETDLDSLPEIQASPPAMWNAHGGSVVDLLLEEGSGAGRRTDPMGELLPYSVEGQTGWKSWRGGDSIPWLRPDMVQSSHPLWGSSTSQGLGSSNSYFSTSSSAEDQVLSQSRELPGRKEEEDDELSYKKEQLMECLRRKLAMLREVQRGLQEDVRANTQLGEEVEALLQTVCQPSLVDRFHMVTGDLEKVVSLLLSLSSRLLRVETALEDLSAENHHTQLPLLEKKQQLLAQLTEAQELKKHVDGRQRAVCRALGSSLTAEQLRDYSHFLRMKAALLVEQRQLEDKIRLHEQQLRAIRESLASCNDSPAGLGYSYY